MARRERPPQVSRRPEHPRPQLRRPLRTLPRAPASLAHTRPTTKKEPHEARRHHSCCCRLSSRGRSHSSTAEPQRRPSLVQPQRKPCQPPTLGLSHLRLRRQGGGVSSPRAHRPSPPHTPQMHQRRLARGAPPPLPQQQPSYRSTARALSMLSTRVCSRQLRRTLPSRRGSPRATHRLLSVCSAAVRATNNAGRSSDGWPSPLRMHPALSLSPFLRRVGSRPARGLWPSACRHRSSFVPPRTRDSETT
jgi:hypothetical protein